MKKNILLTCMLFFASSATHAHDTSSALENAEKPSISPATIASYKTSYDNLTYSSFSQTDSTGQLVMLVGQTEELKRTLESYTEKNTCKNSIKLIRSLLQNVDTLLNKYLKRTSNELLRLLPKLAELEQLKIERALQDHSLAIALAITTTSEFSPAFEQLLNAKDQVPGLFTNEDLSPDNELDMHPSDATGATTGNSKKSLSPEDQIRIYQSKLKKYNTKMERIYTLQSNMTASFSKFLEEERLTHMQLIQQVSTNTELAPKINKSNALFVMFHSRLKKDWDNWQKKQDQLLKSAGKKKKQYLDSFLEAQRLVDEEEALKDEFECITEEVKSEEDTFESI